MSTFLTPPVWYDETGNKIDILNNKTYSDASAVPSMAIGTFAMAGSPEGDASGAVAVGSQAKATATYSIAIGSYDEDNLQAVQALAHSSIAIGAGAKAYANSTGGIAIGYSASATASNSIAIGRSATVEAAETIAIGADAVASTSNTIQLGSNNNAYTLNVGNGRMSLGIGSTLESNWVSATSNNISQGLYLVRYRAGTYINTVYLMAPIPVTNPDESGISKNDWYFPFNISPFQLTTGDAHPIVTSSYYLKVDKTSTVSNLKITPGYYTNGHTFVNMPDEDQEYVMLFKIL